MTSKNVAGAVRPYAIALVSTGTATWMRTTLDPVLGNECPFSLYYLSVLLTAWLAGTYPAIVSLVLGTMAASYFFVPPTETIKVGDPSDLVNAGIYVFVNCVAISLFASLEHQRSMLEGRLLENEILGASLRRADERKDEFLALLAHELRNPLAPIRSSLLLLEKRKGCLETTEKVRVICQRQIHQLIRLVDDLLDISRFLRGSLKLQVERVDLRDAIQVAIDMVEESVQEKCHRFDTLLPSTPVWIDGDPVRLAQLIENLLGNAVKYTPNSGRILLQLDEVDGNAVLSITDNGIGFPPSESIRILEPFTQMDTSRTREYGGLGIGLSIVRQLVELHHGTLIPESRGPGTGSRFTVTLPLSITTNPPSSEPDPKAASEANLVNAPEQNPAPLQTAQRNCVDTFNPATCETLTDDDSRRKPKQENSLLIVEDNVDAAAALCELLELEGIDVRVAHDAVEALKAMEVSIPRVILMDIGLPGMDGYQLAQRIRSRWSDQQISIIACTGWGGADDRKAAKDAGFDHHLVKPVHFTDLMTLMKHSLAMELNAKTAADTLESEASI